MGFGRRIAKAFSVYCFSSRLLPTGCCFNSLPFHLFRFKNDRSCAMLGDVQRFSTFFQELSASPRFRFIFLQGYKANTSRSSTEERKKDKKKQRHVLSARKRVEGSLPLSFPVDFFLILQHSSIQTIEQTFNKTCMKERKFV